MKEMTFEEWWQNNYGDSFDFKEVAKEAWEASRENFKAEHNCWTCKGNF